MFQFLAGLVSRSFTTKMMSLLMMLSTSILLSSQVSALECHTCADLSRHIGQSSLECEASYLKNHTSELLQGCAVPPSGFTTRCTKFGGEAKHKKSAGSSVLVDGVSRGCGLFKESSIPENKCYVGEEANPWLPYLVPSSDGATVNGVICFCEGSGCNGVAFLKPFSWLFLSALTMLCVLLR
ncbi:uncharacterized protein LOC117301641 [Asterias rubens]|uniref:uncharacterized protein LOC117301641 n=1 Tax=Asterias rubens TaxID=7604 RepID=UPI001454ECA2|nr:uncharacterized protein LOC117301641 [Asterias rubens]